jgi:nucleoside-diphosphate-sugar epimerase
MHPDGSTSAPLVLVTGVSGFLGAHCAQQLLAACRADSRPVPTGEDAVRRWAKEKGLIAN